MLLTGTASCFSAVLWPWWVTVPLVFLHGMVVSFIPNAVHELGHGTVFKTRTLNVFFCHVVAFLGWNNHEMFQASHTRHHRYTLHPPDDLEVVLPIRLMIRDFFRDAFVNPRAVLWAFKYTWRIARGKFKGEWELTLFPPSAPEKRIPAVRWARAMLAGHALILFVSILTGQWMIPVVISLAPFYGSWLFYLCNNTQHVGLQDNVSDFRLCSRTFTLNPLVRFLYWQMNYHIEHHMYAAVPCYNLKKLHRLIKHDLPATPRGLYGVWKDIIAILKIQEKDPSYQHIVALPPPSPRVTRTLKPA
jgi:fatty acid desaturase